MKRRFNSYSVSRCGIESLEDRRLLAVTFTIEQLTDNATFDSNPWVWGDQIVWQGRGGTDEGTDDEVFWYDGTTTTQLTENSTPDQYPKLSALGLAWERGTGATKKIIYHDTVDETTLDSTPLGNFSNVFTLTDDRLAWEGASETDFEIFTWTGSGDPTNLSDNTFTDRYVNGDGNSLVWVEIEDATRRVRYFDGDTTTTIGTSARSIEDPKISGQVVAWEGFKGNVATDREIYYYDGTTDHQLTDNAFSEFDPQVSGQNIVWWGGVFNYNQVYLFDGSAITPLSTGTLNQFPQIDGNRVVWQGSDGNDMEIFYYDGETVTQLTDNDLDDTNPRISGNHVVWQGAIPFDGNSSEIFHAHVVPAVTTVAGRHIFYNQSVWDGNSAAISAVNDNAAIATDKTPYLPGAGTAVFDSVTSFSRGINGIMIDLSAGVNHSGLTLANVANNFVFKFGNNNTPGSWAAAPAPAAVSMIAGGGVSGSDRVEITWASGSISNQWLEVQVLATAQTGLTTPDVFFWGNKIGDSGTGTPAGTFDTTTTDAAQVFATLGAGKPITDLRDYNRDGQVTTTDAAIVFANLGTITRLNVGTAGPFAPADEGDVGIASALASTGATPRVELANLPPGITNRLGRLDLNSGRIANFFQHLANQDTPGTRKILQKIDAVADDLGLEHELVEELVASLGL